MSSILIQAFPNVIVIKEEIKKCQGCQLSMNQHFHIKSLNEDQQKELGIVGIWKSSYQWGKQKLETRTVRHIDNHTECYNYKIECVQRIVYSQMDASC